jgi:hypothetical protein
MGYNYLFTNKGVTVFRRSDNFFAFKGLLRGKLYLVDFIPEKVELDRCLIAKTKYGLVVTSKASPCWYEEPSQIPKR